MAIAAIRRRLRQIRYYSASRPSSAWGRTTDAALGLALLLAVPASWVASSSVVTRSEPAQITGRLYRDPDGTIRAQRAPDAGEPEARPRGDAVFAGAFMMRSSIERYGWPFESRAVRSIEGLNVELFEEGRSLSQDDVPAGSPLRAAIEGAIPARPASAIDRRGAAWLGNFIAWSLMLPAAAWVVMSVARLIGWMLVMVPVRIRQQRRRQVNRCPRCNYDLRASTFSERCPECGTVLA